MCTVFSSRFIFQAKRQLCRVLWRQFRAKKELLTEFLTSFSFLTIRANLKQNNSCAVWFQANLEIQVSCARPFSQALPSQQYRLIWSKTTVAQGVLPLISSRRTVAHGVLDKFELFKKCRPFQAKRQFRSVILWPISSNRELRTEFLTTFSFLTLRANWKQNDSSAVWVEANFEQQHGCARCFLQVLSKTANESFLDIIVHSHQPR